MRLFFQGTAWSKPPPLPVSLIILPYFYLHRLEKRFVYLVQTESCLPSYLANKINLGEESSCRCDVIVISYKEKCTSNNFTHVQYIYSKCTWTSGRNKWVILSAPRGRFFHPQFAKSFMNLVAHKTKLSLNNPNRSKIIHNVIGSIQITSFNHS